MNDDKTISFTQVETEQVSTESAEKIDQFFDKATAVCQGGTNLAESVFHLIVRWTVTGFIALIAIKCLYGIALAILAMR